MPPFPLPPRLLCKGLSDARRSPKTKLAHQTHQSSRATLEDGAPPTKSTRPKPGPLWTKTTLRDPQPRQRDPKHWTRPLMNIVPLPDPPMEVIKRTQIRCGTLVRHHQHGYAYAVSSQRISFVFTMVEAAVRGRVQAYRDVFLEIQERFFYGWMSVFFPIRRASDNNIFFGYPVFSDMGPGKSDNPPVLVDSVQLKKCYIPSRFSMLHCNKVTICSS